MEQIRTPDEELEDMMKCRVGENCRNCRANERTCTSSGVSIRTLATELHNERKEPKVWDGAPVWADQASVVFGSKLRDDKVYKNYTRELQKSRARQIAEEYTEKLLSSKGRIQDDSVAMIEQAILKYVEETNVR